MQGFRGQKEEGDFGDDSSNYGIGGGARHLNNYLSQFDNGTVNLKNKISARLGGDKSGFMSPQGGSGYSDYKSEFGGPKEPYLVANAMGVRPYKVSETPNLKNAELQNYLNWVPNKEKFNLANLQNGKKSNKLSPLRSGGSVFNEDDRRSNMSKTVLKVRERFNYSQAREEADEISVDGFSISA